jgi:hypothetical protein
MTRIIFLLLPFSLCVISCSTQKEQQENPNEELLREVIAIHDSAMAKMKDITTYQMQIKNMPDSVQTDSALVATYNKLESAHDGMMEWMRDFSQKFPSGKLMSGNDADQNHGSTGGEVEKRTIEEDKRLLDELKVSAKKMSRAINESLEAAEDMLKNKNDE